MTWNHRVIKRVYDHGEIYYNIHEVYYDDDGNIVSWTVDPTAPTGEDSEILRAELERYILALSKPILIEIKHGDIEVLEEIK